MAYCKKCGSKLDLDALFCTECGTPIANSKTGKRAKAEQETQKTSSEAKENSDAYKTQVRSNSQTYGYLNLENLPAGHIVDERYEVKEKVGQGGFGAVYRVFDKTMETEKALKIIPESI